MEEGRDWGRWAYDLPWLLLLNWRKNGDRESNKGVNSLHTKSDALFLKRKRSIRK